MRGDSGHDIGNELILRGKNRVLGGPVNDGSGKNVPIGVGGEMGMGTASAAVMDCMGISKECVFTREEGS